MDEPTNVEIAENIRTALNAVGRDGILQRTNSGVLYLGDTSLPTLVWELQATRAAGNIHSIKRLRTQFSLSLYEAKTIVETVLGRSPGATNLALHVSDGFDHQYGTPRVFLEFSGLTGASRQQIQFLTKNSHLIVDAFLEAAKRHSID